MSNTQIGIIAGAIVVVGLLITGAVVGVAYFENRETVEEPNFEGFGFD